MKHIVENIIKNIVSTKDIEKSVKLMKCKNLRSYIRKNDIVNFKRIEAIKNRNSNTWGTQAKGEAMTQFIELSESELQARAKALICRILQKTKCKFTHNQAKLAIDCCTREELVRCFNSSHYNTDALLSLVGKKCQKYNK